MIPLIRHATSIAALGALAAVARYPLANPVHASTFRPPAPPTCEDLATFAWGGFTLDDVATVEATESDPTHCRVRGTIDTEIGFELLLPLPADWNGRFIMGGGGGYVGSVQNQALGYLGSNRVLTRGFATVGTDTGQHLGGAAQG